MTRAYIQAQPNPPLANTGTGAAGTVLGTERAKLQALVDIRSLAADFVLSGTQLTMRDATAAVSGKMTAAYAAKLDGIQAGAEVNPVEAERLATAAQSGIMTAAYASKLDSLYVPLTPDNTNLGSEQAINNSGYTGVLYLSITDTRSRPTLVSGHVTFRNTSGGDAIGYFRVRHVSSGTVVASGQADVRNNQRVTVGFAGLHNAVVNSSDQYVIDGRSSVGSGMVVTHQNGMGDSFATTLLAIAQGA